MAGQLAAAAGMQVNVLAAPQALQDKKLHLGKKVIAGGLSLPDLFIYMSVKLHVRLHSWH